MIKGTTPTLTLTVKSVGLDLAEADSVYATVEQSPRKVTKTGESLEIQGNVVRCWLTQKESLSFQEGVASVQLNWIYRDVETGEIKRGATKAKNIEIGKQLLPEVLRV